MKESFKKKLFPPTEITKFNKQFCFNLGGKYFIRRRRVKLIYPFASINTRFFTLKQFCLRKKVFFRIALFFALSHRKKPPFFFVLHLKKSLSYS